MWKSDQKKKLSSKNLKLALLALLILGLLLICGRIFQFFQEFKKPFYALPSYQKSYSWDGNSVINLIIGKIDKNPQGEGLSQLNLVSLNPEDGTITIIKLSGEIYLDIPKNFGFWKLDSIYKLGQENNPQIGEDLVKMSVSKMMGMPIDGLIEVDSKTDLDVQNLTAEWKKNIFTGFNFLTQIKTDLTLNETTDFIIKASKVRSDKIIAVDLFRSAITQSKLLPDSSRVLGVDGVKLDTFIKQTLNDPLILSEDLTIAVFNGTDHPGLTSSAVRLINNLGARVTITSNTENKFVKNNIYINPESENNIKISRSFNRLAQLFAPDCLKSGCLLTDSEVLSSRADISIVLGEEYFNYWSLR